MELTDDKLEVQVRLRLSRQAVDRINRRAAEAGKEVASILSEVIESAPETGGSAPAVSREEWSAALREWALGHRRLTHRVDDSRESIYAGRGE